MTTMPPAVAAALLGLFWVIFNILVVWLGVTYGYSLACPVVAGGVDGAAVAIIAVKKASSRFQAGVTGFLGGLGLNRLESGSTFASKAAEKVHHFVDWLLGVIAPASESVHQQVEEAVLKIVWVAIFVILAALVAEWVRASKAERAALTE